MRFVARLPVCVLLAAFLLWMGAAAAHGTRGSLTRVGVLSVSGSDGAAGLGDVAVDGGIAVATNGVNGYVFAEPADGWSTETDSAELVDPHGLDGAAASGHTIVAGEESADGTTSDLAVFVEPPGGWSGMIASSARLASSGSVLLGSPHISGSTVVASAWSTTSVSGWVDVFSEPAGGWSGTLNEAARLTDSQGLSLTRAVISGQTIFAVASKDSCCSRVDVFNEPAGGWSGIVHQSATLPASGGVSVSGQTVLVQGRIFRKPRAGWSGVIQPVGALIPEDQQMPTLWQSLSAGTAAMNTYELGAEHNCPCQTQIWVFTEPPTGWSGAYYARPVLGDITNNGEDPLDVDGRYLFTGDGTDQLSVFALNRQLGQRAQSPTARRSWLTGLAANAPRLRVRLRAGRPAPAISSLRITLPRGLTFSRRERRLNAGIKITGVRRVRAALHHGQLALSWTEGVDPVSLSVGGPALIESKSLLGRARSKRALSLTLRLRAGDFANDSWRLVLRIHAT